MQKYVADQDAQVLTAHGWTSYAGYNPGIWVSIFRQELILVDNDRIVKRYPCSTACAGSGNVIDSGKTPTGWHRVGAKIGDGLAAGAVLKDRRWTGQVWSADMPTEDDLILSRILWLEGLEDGVNRGGDVDTWSRYIYIHGTNRIDDLGKPASAGCIRLDPEQVIDLYDRIDEGCVVLITKE
jgi:lipoprotein-anchoring transpeptidase ErfK/SrfK